MSQEISISHVSVPGRLQDISLQVPAGMKLGIMGRSGAGKTSLISLLTGQLRPTVGRVVAPEPAAVGYIPQNPGATLIPHLPVAESIVEPQVIALRTRSLRHRRSASGPRTGASQASAREQLAALRARIPELMAEIGLDPRLAERTPAQLSGGQRQRVAIARALLGSPELIIADEAFSALDAHNARLLEDLLAKTSATVIFISHDTAALLRMSSHIAVMEHGAISYFGTAESLNRLGTHLDNSDADNPAAALLRAASTLGDSHEP